MFGKSKAQKVREAGPATKATVLTVEKGGNTHGGAGSGGLGGTSRSYHFTVRVVPADEPAFEAEVACRGYDTSCLVGIEPGQKLCVVYDPSDHSKIAVDTEAQQELVAQQKYGS